MKLETYSSPEVKCESVNGSVKDYVHVVNILQGGDFSSSILVFAEIMNALLVVLTVRAVDH